MGFGSFHRKIISPKKLDRTPIDRKGLLAEYHFIERRLTESFHRITI
jgi:hypothetical protein